MDSVLSLDYCLILPLQQIVSNFQERELPPATPSPDCSLPAVPSDEQKRERALAVAWYQSEVYGRYEGEGRGWGLLFAP